tara:strand:+ start:3195 stop:4718 length:1524 start_codon:yes stop_codon:yes gene_type:complete
VQKILESFKLNKKYFRADILAGITVALALVPEAIAFAFVAGVTPLMSLQTAILMALVAAVFTGRPGMISSSTAAIAVVLAPLIAQYGNEYLFACVLLMGVLQVLCSVFKLGKYTRIIPYPVVLGFLNGLAILIFKSQFELFKVDGSYLPFMDFGIMLFFVAITMLIIHFLPRLTKAIPSALAGIGLMTLVAVFLDTQGIYHLQTVADFAGGLLVGTLPSFHIPEFVWSLESLKIIFPFAVTASLAGLTEATLTLRVLDEMTGTRGHMNKEYFAQGLGNLVVGFFGGMGGDAMVGQSIINTQSGGRTRLSGITAGLGLLVFLMFAAPVVNAIPLASLVGLMFMVVVSTFKWETFKYKGKLPTSDIVVVLLTSMATIIFDLATAVVIGIIVSALVFSWEKGKQIEVRTSLNKRGEKIYKINGILFFGSSLAFKNSFDVQNDPEKIIIDLKYGKIMDTSSLEAINSVVERYQAVGKKVLVTRAQETCRALLKNSSELTVIESSDEYDPTS